jgi:DNA primase
VVYPQPANYYCFGCGAGGDVIDFVSRVNGVGFVAAVRMLNGEAPTKVSSVIEAAHRFPLNPPTEAQVRVIDAAVTFYHESLWSSPAALAYLALRGIDRETAQRCRIGYGALGLAPYLRGRGFRLDDARTVGLLSRSRETMLGRIVVPELQKGHATWMAGRALDKATPRYLNLRLPTPLLGLAQVNCNDVIVAEGVFDWLMLSQWGFPAVGLLGTRTSKRAIEALQRFDHVYIALDSDDAGRRASAELALAIGAKAVVVELPAGVHDVNDLGRLVDGRRAFEHCLELANNGRKIVWETTDEQATRQAA